MLESKDSELSDMVFSFVESFVDQTTGKYRDLHMTQVDMMFSGLERWLECKDNGKMRSDEL